MRREQGYILSTVSICVKFFLDIQHNFVFVGYRPLCSPVISDDTANDRARKPTSNSKLYFTLVLLFDNLKTHVAFL